MSAMTKVCLDLFAPSGVTLHINADGPVDGDTTRTRDLTNCLMERIKTKASIRKEPQGVPENPREGERG